MKKRKGPRYTQRDRAKALENIDVLLDDEELAERVHDLYDDFYDDVESQPDLADPELMAHQRMTGHHAFVFWAFFDTDLEPGRLVDRVLADRATPPGERAFLRAMRDARLRLYEVMRVEPGRSLTLRDALAPHATPVRVREISGSRCLERGALVATRIVPGASGELELDGGLFNYAELQRPHVLAAVEEEIALLRRDEPGISEDEIWRELAPVLHIEWRTLRMPKLANYDGDLLAITRVRFAVHDAGALRAALDGAEGLERVEDEHWMWTGMGASRQELVTLGRLDLREDGRHLTLETNSTQRAERGRALVEAAAGGALAYETTVIEDFEAKMRERLRSGEPDEPEPELDAATREQLRDMGEQLMIDHQRQWIDESVPALDGATPRDAARSRALRPKLVALLEMADRMYEGALRDGAPAADPSWLREELDVPDERRPRDPSRPPPLAHERMGELIPGFRELARTIADRVRRAPDYSPSRSIDHAELRDDLGFQRFLRGWARAAVEKHADPETALTEADLLGAHLELAANFELHYRKVFWVSDALSWMLGATRLDAKGEMLRLPFGSFALVFTDRHALGLAERMLSREPGCRIRGHLLDVATVYVTRTAGPDEDSEGIRLAIACDMLDPDWPYLLVRDLVVRPGATLDEVVESRFPGVHEEDLAPMFRCTPLRELVRLVLNAVLYATSADAERVELGAAPARKTPRAAPQPPPLTSETVFHLPGTIDIAALREVKHARRGFTDRQQVHRCMVRGHWRMPAKSYEDQRPRWIAPYWRGPSVAAVVERPYRLRE